MGWEEEDEDEEDGGELKGTVLHQSKRVGTTALSHSLTLSQKE